MREEEIYRDVERDPFARRLRTRIDALAEGNSARSQANADRKKGWFVAPGARS
jgi:hypothetical protein